MFHYIIQLKKGSLSAAPCTLLKPIMRLVAVAVTQTDKRTLFCYPQVRVYLSLHSLIQLNLILFWVCLRYFSRHNNIDKYDNSNRFFCKEWTIPLTLSPSLKCQSSKHRPFVSIDMFLMDVQQFIFHPQQSLHLKFFHLSKCLMNEDVNIVRFYCLWQSIILLKCTGSKL